MCTHDPPLSLALVKAIKVTSASVHNLSKKKASVHKNKTKPVKTLKQISHSNFKNSIWERERERNTRVRLWGVRVPREMPPVCVPPCICVRRALHVAEAGCCSAAPPSVLCVDGPMVTGFNGWSWWTGGFKMIWDFSRLWFMNFFFSCLVKLCFAGNVCCIVLFVFYF